VDERNVATVLAGGTTRRSPANYRAGVQITLQYFDGCPNWEATDRLLTEIAAERPDVTITRRRVETAAEAESLGFRGSPTVLIDGVDPFADDGAPIGLACRVYRTPGALAGSPTAEQLRAAVGDRR
jgi:glutaredoxin